MTTVELKLSHFPLISHGVRSGQKWLPPVISCYLAKLGFKILKIEEKHIEKVGEKIEEQIGT